MGPPSLQHQSAPTKKERVEAVLKEPAILARGYRDDLIEFDPDTQKARWKPEAENKLLDLDEGVLIMFNNVIRNKKELQSRQW